MKNQERKNKKRKAVAEVLIIHLLFSYLFAFYMIKN